MQPNGERKPAVHTTHNPPALRRRTRACRTTPIPRGWRKPKLPSLEQDHPPGRRVLRPLDQAPKRHNGGSASAGRRGCRGWGWPPFGTPPTPLARAPPPLLQLTRRLRRARTLAGRLLAASQHTGYPASGEASRQRSPHMRLARCPPPSSARLAFASLRYSSASMDTVDVPSNAVESSGQRRHANTGVVVRTVTAAEKSACP